MKIYRTENILIDDNDSCLGGIVIYDHLKSLSFDIVSCECNWIKINNINCDFDKIYQIEITGHDDYSADVYLKYYDSSLDVYAFVMGETILENEETTIEIDDCKIYLSRDNDIINLGNDTFGIIKINPIISMNNPIARENNYDEYTAQTVYSAFVLYADNEFELTSIVDLENDAFSNKYCIEDLGSNIFTEVINDRYTDFNKTYESSFSGSLTISQGNCAVIYFKSLYNPNECGIHINKIEITYTENNEVKKQYLYGGCYSKNESTITNTFYYTDNDDDIEILYNDDLGNNLPSDVSIIHENMPLLRGMIKYKNEYGYENLFNYNDLKIEMNESGIVSQIKSPDILFLENEGCNIRIKSTYTHDLQKIKPTHFRITYGYPEKEILIGVKSQNLQTSLYHLDYLIVDPDVFLFDNNIEIDLCMYNKSEDANSEIITNTILIDYENTSLSNIEIISNQTSNLKSKYFHNLEIGTGFVIFSIDGYTYLQMNSNIIQIFTDGTHDKGIYLSGFTLIESDVFDYAITNNAIESENDKYYLCNNGFRIAEIDFINLTLKCNSIESVYGGRNCPIQNVLYTGETETFINAFDMNEKKFITLLSVNSIENQLYINIPIITS